MWEKIEKIVVITRKRRSLVLETNYHTAKGFSENLLAIEMNKIKVKMKKPVYLHLSVLNTSKKVINDLNINDSPETYQIFLLRVQKWFGEGFGWLTEFLNSVYNLLVRSSYIQLPEAL